MWWAPIKMNGRTAVEDPEVRKRFVTFINAKAEQQQDPHIQFAEVRGADPS